MNTFEWIDGTIVEAPYIIIDGTKYYVQSGAYTGTPVSANNLNSMQNILNNNIKNQVKPKLLWFNPNPSVAFSSQNITLSSDDYDYLEIYFYDWLSGTNEKCVKVEKGKNILLDCIFYNNISDIYMGTRPISYISDTQYTAQTCKALYGSSSVQLANQIDFVCVPIKILGYKYN